MKKIILAIVVLAIGATLMTSCKTHERCPAYGSAAPTSSKKSV